MITSRLAAIGFAVPRCADAAEFFQPLVEQAEVILQAAARVCTDASSRCVRRVIHRNL